jgi:SAM-dependent methyltransferase
MNRRSNFRDRRDFMDLPQSAEWSQFHAERMRSNYPRWPNEPMLKVLFGNYSSAPAKPQAGWRVLDVGCGFGNNLRPFAELGCECDGVEIDDTICALTRRILQERGYRAEIRTGTNRGLPYDAGRFDLLLSVATIHYETCEAAVREALEEFRRVLRPGGVLYLSTVGPTHDIRRRAEALGSSTYRIQNYDFRDGQVFFFFNDEEHLATFCREVFKRVEVGRVTEVYFGHTVEHLVALCR